MILDYNRLKLGLLAARRGGRVKALLIIIAAGALAACAGSSAPGDVAAKAVIAPAPPAVSIDPATGEASVTIRVMTWNVEGLPIPIRFGRAHALEEIGDALASMRARGEAPHILLVQEGFMRGPMERLISRSGYAYVSRGPRAGDEAAGSAEEMGEPWRLRGEGLGKVLDGGLYILSDFPILDTQTEAFASCAGFDCLANKGVMLARIRIPGAPDPLAVLNTHLNSRSATRAPIARANLAHRAQIDALERFVRDTAREHEPFIFGGDFNMAGSPQRWSYAVPLEQNAFANAFCLQDTAHCDVSAMPVEEIDPRTRQDQHGFHDGTEIRVRPVRLAMAHSAATDDSLSDHGAFVVDYRLSWDMSQRQVAQGPTTQAQATQDAPRQLPGLFLSRSASLAGEAGPAGEASLRDAGYAQP